MIREDVINAVTDRYNSAGFSRMSSSNDAILKFKNDFSVHYVFLFNSLEDLLKSRRDLENIFEQEYLMAEDLGDLYWNYYSIYIIDVLNIDKLRKDKETIENDVRMSRKFVFQVTELDKLPPLFFEPIIDAAKSGEEFWEEGWRNAIGEELYDRIEEGGKTYINDILLEWLDAEINKDK